MLATQVPEKRQVQIAVEISAVMLFGVLLVNALAVPTLIHDFTNIYLGARIISQGEGARLYDLGMQAQVEEAVFHWGGFFVFNHPPFEAWLFAPLSRLPYAVAYTIWGVVNIVLWVFFVYLFRPYAPIPKQPLQYLLLCFSFFPLWIALVHGQMSILLLVLLSLTFVSLKRRRDGWAGVFLGLGLFKFPVVAPLALIFLLKGKWRLIARFASTGLLLGLGSLLAVGRAGMIGYVNLLVDQVRRPDYPPYCIEVWKMPNLRGFFHVILSPVLPESIINLVVALASVTLIGYVAWRWRRQVSGEGPSFDLMFAAALATSEVTAFHLKLHDLSPVLMAVLLILGYARYPGRSPWRWARTAAIGALYVIPLCLLILRGAPMFLLTPVLILLAWAAMAGAGVYPATYVYVDVD